MNKDYLRDYLFSQDDGVSEYTLLTYLQTNHPNFFSHLPSDSSLFKKHFYLFNQLYQLSDQLKSSGRFIEISSLNIQILANKDLGEGLAEIDELRAFYLDQTNLQLSDKQVSEMLSHFWDKYLAIGQKADAIKCFGLENVENLNKQIITKRFGQLALKHHPDRGGDEEEFLKIKKAYESLKKLF